MREANHLIRTSSSAADSHFHQPVLNGTSRQNDEARVANQQSTSTTLQYTVECTALFGYILP
jgi:hypothetical protein